MFADQTCENQTGFLPSGVEQRKVIRVFPLVLDRVDHSREVSFGIAASNTVSQRSFAMRELSFCRHVRL
jgi:hypothetical protein